LIPDFVKYVFKVWTHTMDFTIALSAIFLPMSIVLWIGETWRNSNMRCLPSQKLCWKINMLTQQLTK
jgi:Fe2+ transport system protein B